MPADWFDHPKYVEVRERLIRSLTSPHYRFRRSEPIVFLCGREKSSARDTLAAYLRKHLPSIRVFYAEAVWDFLSTRQALGALAMEADLANLADLIIIIAESSGTFAELGAFSISPDLRPKLLAIVDSAYSPPQQSFLALGPIHWIEAESRFSPTIYAPLKSILVGVDEISERISRIEQRTARVTSLADNPRFLLLFICDLVSITHPSTVELIDAYCSRILIPAPRQIAIATTMALAKAMGVLKSVTLNGKTFFMPSQTEASSRPYHHLLLTTLPGLRSEHLSALLAIEEVRAVIKFVLET